MRALAALSLALLPSLSVALDRFEVQVYEADINDPGQFALEAHANFTARGERQPAYPGETPPHHAFRLTLEPALGVTRWLELGAYLQTQAAPGRGYDVVGGKLRVKLIAPHGETGLFYGLNVEVGRVSKAVEEQAWGSELRPILGWTDGTWSLAVNPIFGSSLSGPEKLRLDLEPAAKASWNTGLGFAVGAEWYAELGFVDALLPFSRQAHYLLAVVDLAELPGREPGPWELDLAVGGGISTAADQQLLVKMILGRSF